MLSCNLPITELTPALANDWLTHKLFRGQRRMYQSNINSLLMRLEDPRPFPLTFAQMGTVNGEDEQLIDAYHRSMAVSLYGSRSIPIVVARLDFPDEDSLERHYAEIDCGLNRSLKDVVPTSLVGPDGYTCPTNVAVIGQAAEWVTNNLTRKAFAKGTAFPKCQRLQFAVDWSAEAAILFKSTTGDGALAMESKRLRVKPVVSVLLPLLRAYPEVMEELLKSVSRNEGLRGGSAAHKLHSILREKYAGGSALLFAQRIAYCCAKHITGTPCKNISIPDVGVTLPGTDIIVGG